MIDKKTGSDTFCLSGGLSNSKHCQPKSKLSYVFALEETFFGFFKLEL